MKVLKTVSLTILVSFLVAITYFYFELAVHQAINFIWNDIFDTEAHSFLVVPICLVLSLIYFGVQHILDPPSEKHEVHGLGSSPPLTISNFVKVLFIGFLSLLAGASLGPEAILVPACVLIGLYVGSKFSSGNKSVDKLFGVVGFIALITAFFNSFYIGVLSLLLIKKQFKTKINLKIILIGAISAASTVLILSYLNSSAYVETPEYSLSININTMLLFVPFFACGYLITFGLSTTHNICIKVIKTIKAKSWFWRSILASTLLSILYILGGSLVRFTGNESVEPMLKQSADLGLIGLIWIVLIKIFAISWSKASGYRGGLVFPTVFAASVVVAIADLYLNNLNLIYSLLAVMLGVLIADKKFNILL